MKPLAVASLIFCAAAPCLFGQKVPVQLLGQVYDSASRQPIRQAIIGLRGLSTGAAYQGRTDATGTFRIVGLVAGPYAREIRALGYRVYWDTLRLVAGDSLAPVFLVAQPACMGERPADSARMAAARVRRAAWTCTTDSSEIATQRAWWTETLAAPLVRADLRLKPGPGPSPAALELVTDPAVCRRVGAVFERLGRLVDTVSTVFRLGDYLLTSQPGEHNVVLSPLYRVVHYFVWE